MGLSGEGCVRTEKSFRNSAAFGKRMEFYVVGLMPKDGLDVYLPLVDDDAIDAVIKRKDGSFVEVQIKARSTSVQFGHAGLFAALTHELRKNFRRLVDEIPDSAHEDEAST